MSEDKNITAIGKASYQLGVTEERERIINLLEELKEYWSEKVQFEYGIVSAINADEAIDLIKGDPND